MMSELIQIIAPEEGFREALALVVYCGVLSSSIVEDDDQKMELMSILPGITFYQSQGCKGEEKIDYTLHQGRVVVTPWNKSRPFLNP